MTEVGTTTETGRGIITEGTENQPETIFGDVLRFSIDGVWSTTELSVLLECIEEMYQITFGLIEYEKIRQKVLENPAYSFPYSKIAEHLNFVSNKPTLGRDRFDLIDKIKSNRIRFYELEDVRQINLINDNYIFRVLKLKYNSPGSIDLFGIAKVVEIIKDFFKDTLNFVQERKSKSIDISIKEEELRKLKIENTKRILDLAKEYHFDNITLADLSTLIEHKQEKVIQLVQSKKLTNVEIIENDKEVEL